MNTYLTIIVAIAFWSNAAIAENLDINFPELVGDYALLPNFNSYESTAFLFPEDLQSFDEMRLVISGTWVEGLIKWAGVNGPPDSSSFTPGLSMHLTAPAVEGFFHATIPPPNGEFDQRLATFEHCCSTGDGDPIQLIGKEISVEFFCDMVQIGICNIAEGSYGHLTETKIETVGAVKSLFR